MRPRDPSRLGPDGLEGVGSVDRTGGEEQRILMGRMAQVSLRAAVLLADEGISASVLDLRWLNPLDEEAIAAALKESAGRLLIAHEATLTGGFGPGIAARVSERHLFELDAPIVRIGMPDARVPSSPVLQAAILPNEQSIVDAARRLVSG